MSKNKTLSQVITIVFGLGCLLLLTGLIGIFATEPNAEWSEAATSLGGLLCFLILLIQYLRYAGWREKKSNE